MLAKNLLRARIAFIRQGSEVERYHTKRMLQRNDVGHHSYHVAWLANIMMRAGEHNPAAHHRVVMAALAHDLAEHITGDMPGDFKREMGIRDEFSGYEDSYLTEVGLNYNDQMTAEEERILKMADMMEGAFYCISEASLGNARVGIVYKNFRSYIEKFQPFSECEMEIVAYIDELWAHYGVSDAPNWSRTAHDVASQFTSADASAVAAAFPPLAENKGTGLLDALRAEQAGGRATEGLSKARVLEVPCTQDAPVNDASDDRASTDLAPDLVDTSLPANARQYGGDHYKGTGYEHWDLVLDTGMNYFQGCATKYVTRARKHSAGPRLNLLKAIHYIDKAQEADNAGRLPEGTGYNVSDIVNFGQVNGLWEAETQALKDIIAGRWDNAREGLTALLIDYPEEQ